MTTEQALSKPIRILYIDDNPHDRDLVYAELTQKSDNFVVTVINSRHEFNICGIKGHYDLVLSEHTILGYDALQIIDVVHSSAPDVPVVILTGAGSEELAVAAMKKGASDYIVKSSQRIQTLPALLQEVVTYHRHSTMFTAATGNHALIADRTGTEEQQRIQYIAAAFSKSAIAIGSLSQEIIYANDAFLQLWGYDNRQEVLGRIASAFWVQEEQLQGTIQALQQTGCWRGEMAAKRKDGTFINVEVIANLVTDSTNQPICFMVSFFDVTDRHRAEIELKQREQEFKALVENSPDIIIRLNREGRIKYANPAAKILSKIPLTNLIGQSVRTLMFSEEAIAEYERVAAHVFATGEQATFTVSLPLHEQPLAFYQARLAPEYGTDGAVETILGIVRDISDLQRAKAEVEQLNQNLEKRVWQRTAQLDNVNRELRNEITERKHAEQALRESESRLRSVITNAPIVLYTFKRDGIITFCEGKDLAMLGWEPAQLVGQSIFDIYHDQPKIVEDTNRVLSGEMVNSLHELAGITFESWYTPLYEPDGSIDGAIGVSVDITDLKIVEVALRESEQRYQTLASLSPVGIFQTDVNGDCNYVNERWCAIAGISTVEAIGSEWFKVIHPEDHAYVRAEWHQSTQTQRSFVAEYRIRRPDGTATWVLGQASAEMGSDGSVLGYIGTITDITTRKQNENDLHQRTSELSKANEELAQTSRHKDEFLASMSHELRTPLTTILGHSESLQEQIQGPLNERQLKALRSIEESGRHLQELIDDILALAKIEAGQITLNISSVSVAPLCETSLRMIAQMASKKQISVALNIDNTITTIEADERRLRQILVNLLANAVKFTPAGNAIGLEVTGNQAQGVVHFAVWDTGIGISLEDQRDLFKPFVQVDSALSRQYEGSGLGLALVERLTKLHNGSVHLESTVGQGSRFIVTLPWRRVNNIGPDQTNGPSLTQLEHSPTDPGGQTILLVEDNEENSMMLQTHLATQGYHIVSAYTGHEALTKTQITQPDIILMDIQMPGMDGLEATRRIRAKMNMLQIPIIALTALAMPGDREQCLAAGANAYLSKPVHLKELTQLMASLLQTYHATEAAR
ncbi:MAG: PAS domain S-box protein [Chloroflexales bacterium]|nr:PAS domain S-box protein [Chloroflexales bacterium]